MSDLTTAGEILREQKAIMESRIQSVVADFVYQTGIGVIAIETGIENETFHNTETQKTLRVPMPVSINVVLSW